MTKKLERFTPVARQLVFYSEKIANGFDSRLITLEFILLAMVETKNSDAFMILDEFDVIKSKLLPFLKTTIFSEIEPLNDKHPLQDQLNISEDTKRLLELSVISARELGQPIVTSANLLIGLMRLDSELIDEILKHFDVQRKDVIKKAEYYVLRGNTVERKEGLAFLAQQDTTLSTRFFAKIRTLFGLVDNKNDAE